MKKLKNKKVLVYGFGISGQGAINLLNEKRAKTFLFDKNYKKAKQAKKVNVVKELNEDFLKQLDLVVISPAVSIYNKNIELIKKLEIQVISELELGFLFCKGQVIAVTGTNGKTTTVELLYKMFKNAKKNVCLVGNIGISFCDEVLKKKKDYYIAEVSSFQLEAINRFKPKTAIILNITQDHIDRHKKFETYVKEKFKIFKNQERKNIAVLNADDNNIIYKAKNLKAKKFYFSLKQEVKGCYLKDKKIYYANKKQEVLVCNRKDLPVSQEYNVQNILASITVAVNYDISLDVIKNTIKEFKVRPHRMEFITFENNIEFYNDSKATNADACLKACASLSKPIYLIIGGSLKGEDNKNLLQGLKINKNIKKVVCYGQVCDEIKKLNTSVKLKNITYKPKFKESFSFIVKQAKKESIVLLSPAFASFGEFTSYKQRGEEFKRLVEELDFEK